MEDSKKDWLVIILLAILIIVLIYYIIIYNTTAIKCMTEPLIYLEEINNASCFCFKPEV